MTTIAMLLFLVACFFGVALGILMVAVGIADVREANGLHHSPNWPPGAIFMAVLGFVIGAGASYYLIEATQTIARCAS